MVSAESHSAPGRPTHITMKTRLKLLLLFACLAVTIWIGFFTRWSLDDMQAAYATVPMSLLIAASFAVPILDVLVGAVALLLALGFGFYLGLILLMAIAVGSIAGTTLLLCAMLLFGCVASLALTKAVFWKTGA